MKTKIIADIGSNHMGDLDIAKAMIKCASSVGIDTVKFQSWQADSLRKDFPDYKQNYKMYKKLELSDKDHEILLRFCTEQKIHFLTTCFDLKRVKFLSSLGLKTIKVASPDCTSFKLLEKLMKHFGHLIISTGMSTDEEVIKMINFVKGHNATFLHCVSLYPTPLEKVNLERMLWLKSFGVKVGFSDHSMGTDAGKLAISLGAKILEKHFTLSRNLPGKDQSISSTPEEFKEFVKWTDLVEKMRGVKNPGLSDKEVELRKTYIGKWGNNK